MSSENANAGSITIWLHAMRAGDDSALRSLWKRYNAQLVNLARQRLKGLPGSAIGEEDIAISAFTRLSQAAAAGRLDGLCNRHDLWRLLLTMTLDKAADAYRRETAQRRGGDAIRVDIDDPAHAKELPVDESPSPEAVAIFVDLFRQGMHKLGQDDLREIAVLHLHGHSPSDIASRVGVSERTIERRVQLIRKIWTQVGARG